MSTADLNPVHVPVDDTPLSDRQPRDLKKTCVALTPPTILALLVGEQLSLQDGAAQTFVVDLTALGRGALGESQKDDCKSSAVGEHQIDDSHSPPSPHDPPEKTHLPLLSLDSDAAPAGASPTSASASIKTPIEPPGLPRPVDDPPVDDAPAQADEAAVLAVENGEAGGTTSSCFSLSGLETLRTFIPDDLLPDDLLPDDLLVYDPDNLTNLRIDKSQSSSDIPVRYVRIFPQASVESGTSQVYAACVDRSPQAAGHHPVRVAHLYLKEDNKLGGGHHGSVYSARFRLPLDAESDEENTVRVAVKTAFARCGPHEMLRREAVAYGAFPRHLMEDRHIAASPQSVGVATAVPDSVPQPDTEPELDATFASTSEDASTDGADSECTHAPTHQPAVVPKFFGYYAPVDADGRVIEHSHPSCDIDSVCAVTWPTRLLLIEECGKPVVLEERPLEQRTCCLELFKRLHAAGFTQGSVYARNILVQSGPLSAPPEERSVDTPSFRIIDFGRVKMLADFSPESEESFVEASDREVGVAYEVLVELNDWPCW